MEFETWFLVYREIIFQTPLFLKKQGESLFFCFFVFGVFVAVLANKNRLFFNSICSEVFN
jgi:hypothetical protein